MDHLTLGSPAETVAADIDHIRAREEFTGLRNKDQRVQIRIISRGTGPRLAQFYDFIPPAPDEAELLEAPLFPDRKMDDALANRCEELTTAVNRLFLLSVHDA